MWDHVFVFDDLAVAQRRVHWSDDSTDDWKSAISHTTDSEYESDGVVE